MSSISTLLRWITFAIVLKETIQASFRSSYGVRINQRYPTSSCFQYNNIPSLCKCFAICLQKIDNFYLYSHDLLNHECLCCKDVPGTPLTGSQWKTFMPSPCPEGYTTYNYTYFEICLKYVTISTEYPDAVENCKQDGGDLIKIDSLEKYDIFKIHSGKYKATGHIQVWVQGVEDNNQQWRFHDGTLMPGHCLSGQSNQPGENHMRAKSDDNFRCHDDSPLSTHHYVCEIYRLFP